MAAEDESGPGTSGSAAWMIDSRRICFELSEALDFAPLSPDIEFVAFLRSLSQFGFFRFGPITIDVNVVEDILMRTHPHGAGGPDHPASTESYVRLGEFTWRLSQERGSPRIDELVTLLAHMYSKDGLAARVFGELGVSPEDVERYVSDLGAKPHRTTPATDKLFSTESAADYLGVHVQTVRSWIRSGKLPAARLAGQKSIRIRGRDLESVLEPIDPQQFES